MSYDIDMDNSRPEYDEQDYEDEMMAEFPEDIDISELMVNPDCKYPTIKVQLVGRDGNAFAIMAHVKEGLKSAGISREEQQAWLNEAMGQQSYEMLLNLATRWVVVY